jgi:glycosyltransferase involved in cell wall biosynthesis
VEAPIAQPQELTALRSRLGISASTHVILFFGLIYPGKGIEDLLQALAKLRDRAVDAALLLVGQSGGVTSNAVWNKACDDYVLQMKTLTDNLGLQDRAHWAGHVDDAELGAWFGVSSVACLPFSGGIRANNSTFAVCAAHGIPVVTTTWAGIDSVFQEPDSGIELVPCKNPDRLADALEYVLADSERLSAMRRHIRTAFERYFSRSRFVDVLLSRSGPEAARDEFSAP